LITNNSKIGSWSGDLLDEQFKYLLPFFLGLSATRERRRISHSNWKLKFVPRILRYPPEKLSFQFPLNSGLGGGVIRGLQILIINIVKKYFTQQAFYYNFAGEMSS